MILPMLRNEVALQGLRARRAGGRSGAVDLLLEPHEPSGRHDHHDVAARTGGSRRRPWARRATTSSTCGGDRRSPRSSTAGSRSIGRRGAAAPSRRRASCWTRAGPSSCSPRARARPTGTSSGSVTARRGSASRPTSAQRRSRSAAPTRRWPKGSNWPKAGRPPVNVRFGAPLYPEEGETHQAFSLRMTQAVAELHDEDRSTWWEALHRAERGETPSLHGPTGPDWLRRWEGSRPVPKRRSSSTWE